MSVILSKEVASYIAQDGISKCLSSLYPLLIHHPGYDVRVAAGELVALLFESRLKSNESNLSEDLTADNVNENEGGEEEDEYDIPATTEELIIAIPRVINDLSKENSKFKARTERVTQRKVFRTILDTAINGGDEYSETLTVDGEAFVFLGWSNVRK